MICKPLPTTIENFISVIFECLTFLNSSDLLYFTTDKVTSLIKKDAFKTTRKEFVRNFKL